MENNGENQYLHTAPWQKVLVSVAGIFALAGILAFVYIFLQGSGEGGSFWDRFKAREEVKDSYTEEEKLEILRSLYTEEDLKPMTAEEEAKVIQQKSEVLQAVSESSASEETPPEQEKLDILNALRSAE